METQTINERKLSILENVKNFKKQYHYDDISWLYENYKSLKLDSLCPHDEILTKEHLLVTNYIHTGTHRELGHYYLAHGYATFYRDNEYIAETLHSFDSFKVKKSLLAKLSGHQIKLLKADNINNDDMIFNKAYYKCVIKKFLSLNKFYQGKITNHIAKIKNVNLRWVEIDKSVPLFHIFNDRKKLNEFIPVKISNNDIFEMFLKSRGYGFQEIMENFKDAVNSYIELNKKYRTKVLNKLIEAHKNSNFEWNNFDSCLDSSKIIHYIVVDEYNLQTKSIIRAEKKLQNENYLKQFENKEPDLVFNGQKFYFKHLKTKIDLKIEGLQMDHCVGSYDPQKSDIYSITGINEKKGGVTRGTCQIKDGKIVQLRGVKNKKLPENFTQAVNQVLL